MILGETFRPVLADKTGLSWRYEARAVVAALARSDIRSEVDRLVAVRRPGLHGGSSVSVVTLRDAWDKATAAHPCGRTASCGQPMGDEAVEVRYKDGSAYPSNVSTCGSIWACPRCSAVIRVERSKEIQMAADAHLAMGGKLSMLTLTVRHSRWMGLGEVLRAVQDSWRGLQQSRAWRSLRKKYRGHVRSLEVNVGENGWHPHIHVLIFHPATVDQASVDAAVAELFDTWRAGAVKVLGVGPDREHGISHVWRTSAAEYVTKLQEAGLEAAYADGKRGQYPFGVLEGVQNGDVDSVQLWREYVREMRGKRAIEWSRGLRGEFAVLGEERSDDEVAQAERNGELVATVPAVRWVDMHRRRRSDGRLEVVAFLQDLVADFGPPGRGAWAVAGGGSP